MSDTVRTRIEEEMDAPMPRGLSKHGGQTCRGRLYGCNHAQTTPRDTTSIEDTSTRDHDVLHSRRRARELTANSEANLSALEA